MKSITSSVGKNVWLKLSCRMWVRITRVIRVISFALIFLISHFYPSNFQPEVSVKKRQGYDSRSMHRVSIHTSPHVSHKITVLKRHVSVMLTSWFLGRQLNIQRYLDKKPSLCISGSRCKTSVINKWIDMLYPAPKLQKIPLKNYCII